MHVVKNKPEAYLKKQEGRNTRDPAILRQNRHDQVNDQDHHRRVHVNLGVVYLLDAHHDVTVGLNEHDCKKDELGDPWKTNCLERKKNNDWSCYAVHHVRRQVLIFLSSPVSPLFDAQKLHDAEDQAEVEGKALLFPADVRVELCAPFWAVNLKRYWVEEFVLHRLG
jgi:hypothetical protein